MPKAGFPKLCNYCKNHSQEGEAPVLEKHHRPCRKYNNPEHFKNCVPCERNHRKTENVRKWRKNKINKKLAEKENKEIQSIVELLMKDDIINDIVHHQKIDNFDSSEDIIEMSEEDIIIEEMESEDVESTELPDCQERKDSGLTLMVQHPLFPKMSLNADDAIRFQNQIENLIDDIRENEKTPKFISHVLENGSWRVTSADEFTQNWFQEKAAAFTCLVDDTNVPVRIIPSNEYNICGCFITGKDIDTAKVLSRLNKQNKGLEISRWYIHEVNQQENQLYISFIVDPVSLSIIRENKCMLNYGMNQLHFFQCEEMEGKYEESAEVYQEVIVN
ncbi:uncharacterized protein [Chironomus tepperi]|uniref:uncharacterized protein n=1 Tax=Chironomus tepperi TaxID=113505 RepID=UPI00391F2299